MHPFIRLVLVLAAGAGIGIGGVLVVQTVFVEIPAVLTAPVTAADCDEQFAALVENPVCQGKPSGWMRNFPVTTPVEPNAMPELSYEKKE